MDENEKDEAVQPLTPYPHNALEGFGNGCLLDLRVRFAMDLLRYSQRYAPFRVDYDGDGDGDDNARAALWHPHDAAADALDLASELLAEAERRGLIEPLGTDTTLTPELRAQAARTAHFNVLQQIEGQKFAQDEHARVVPAAPGIRKPTH